MIQRNYSIFLPWLAAIQLSFLDTSSELSAQAYLRSSYPQGFETAKQVKNVEPSVVSIRTYVSQSGQDYCRVGSGFIYNSDGYIVTRESVILGGDSIIVTLTDGRDSRAWVVHHDEVTEMALLKIAIDDLFPIPLI